MKKIKGFTLAEVLITLAIIGVVAALTIPTVIANYQKNMYVTQLKKEYNQITNAFHTAMARDGVTRLSDTKLWSSMPDSNISPTALATNPEFKEEFYKIFNVVMLYDKNTNKLPFPDNKIDYKGLNGNDGYGPGNNTIYDDVCLADGACFEFRLNKNPKTKRCGKHDCASLREFQDYHNTSTKFWQYLGEIRLDVNGINKGPNQEARDFFWFHVGNDGNIYPQGGIDYVFMWGSYDSYGDAIANSPSYWRNYTTYCDPKSTADRGSGWYCQGRIMEEGWKMNY